MSLRREIWTVKHKPKRVEEIVGNEEAKKEFLDWLNLWIKAKKAPAKKAVLLYGPPGIGKTLLVETAANEFGLELIEVNAGDIYSVEYLNKTVIATSKEQSLAGKMKIIMVDEVDSLEGPKANYAINTLLKLISIAEYPVVLIANDGWKPILMPFRNVCLMIEMKKLSEKLIAGYLITICKRENLEYEEAAIKIIASRAEGDMRSAILDLQFCSTLGRIGVKEVNLLSAKDRQTDVFTALRSLIYSTSYSSAKKIADEFPYDQDTLLFWISENIFRFYINPRDLALAFERLSKADIYRARANRERFWRFLLYFTDLITAGVALSKSQKPTYSKMQFPQTLRLLSKQRQMSEIKLSIFQALAKKNHLSKRKVMSELFWYFLIMLKNEDFAKKFFEEYELSEEAKEYLMNLSENIEIKIKKKS